VVVGRETVRHAVQIVHAPRPLLLLLPLPLLALCAGVTHDGVLSCSNVHPHYILDSFGDLLAVEHQARVQPAQSSMIKQIGSSSVSCSLGSSF
jgi:hypothetical protein